MRVCISINPNFVRVRRVLLAMVARFAEYRSARGHNNNYTGLRYVAIMTIIRPRSIAVRYKITEKAVLARDASESSFRDTTLFGIFSFETMSVIRSVVRLYAFPDVIVSICDLTTYVCAYKEKHIKNMTN